MLPASSVEQLNIYAIFETMYFLKYNKTINYIYSSMTANSSKNCINPDVPISLYALGT